MFKQIILFLVIISAALLNAQTPNCDVIYLKNGLILKGNIIEQVPGDFYKIRTFDENILIIGSANVAHIIREFDSTIVNEAKMPLPLFSWRLFTGVGIPRGAFESLPGACSETGFVLGGGPTLNLGRDVGIDLTVLWTLNQGKSTEFVKANGSYSGIVVLPGFRYRGGDPIDYYGFFTANIGLAHYSGPQFKDPYNPWQSLDEANSVAFAFSAGAGYKNKIEVSFLYLNTGMNPINGIDQSVNLLAFVVGVTF